MHQYHAMGEPGDDATEWDHLSTDSPVIVQVNVLQLLTVVQSPQNTVCRMKVISRG